MLVDKIGERGRARFKIEKISYYIYQFTVESPYLQYADPNSVEAIIWPVGNDPNSPHIFTRVTNTQYRNANSISINRNTYYNFHVYYNYNTKIYLDEIIFNINS